MTFSETSLSGTYLIAPVELVDERGFFPRGLCREAFIAQRLNPSLAQCGVPSTPNKERCGACIVKLPPILKPNWYAAREGPFTMW